MLLSLDIRDPDVATQILELQRAAYAVESKLIGYTVPAMHETVADLQACGERFLAYKPDAAYLGAVGYTKTNRVLTIARLVIHPDHFRQGIALRLLTTLEHVNDNIQRMAVQTAAANTPARRLYESVGFTLTERWQHDDGLVLVRFEKRLQFDEAA